VPGSPPTIAAVVNVKSGQRYDVYIGRANPSYNLPASPWANPYIVGQDGDIDTVLDLYEQHVRSSPELCRMLPSLRDKVLGCWCDGPCHGDVLGRLLAEVDAPRWPLAPAKGLAEKIADRFGQLGFVDRIVIAGSIRRGRPDVKDIELVVTPRFRPTQVDLFGEPAGYTNLFDTCIDDLIARDILGYRLDINGRKSAGERSKRLVWNSGSMAGIGIDLFSVLPPAQFGLLQMIRTGPADYSKRLVTPKRKGGLLLDGFRVVNGAIWELDKLGMSTIMHSTPEESDVCRLLGIPLLPPEERQ